MKREKTRLHVPKTVVPAAFVPLLCRGSKEAKLVGVLSQVLLDAGPVEFLPFSFGTELGCEVGEGALGGGEGGLGVGEGDGGGVEGLTGGGCFCGRAGRGEGEEVGKVSEEGTRSWEVGEIGVGRGWVVEE